MKEEKIARPPWIKLSAFLAIHVSESENVELEMASGKQSDMDHKPGFVLTHSHG